MATCFPGKILEICQPNWLPWKPSKIGAFRLGFQPGNMVFRIRQLRIPLERCVAINNTEMPLPAIFLDFVTRLYICTLPAPKNDGRVTQDLSFYLGHRSRPRELFPTRKDPH